jgi:MFS family permease
MAPPARTPVSLARTYLDLFRRNGALTRLLAGEFISGIGDWLYLVAVLVVVYAESNSPVLLGIVGAARILPYVLLSVPAGIVADRFDRRMVLLVTDVARGILMLALVAVVVLDAPTFVIVAISILAACFSTFFGPAIAALLPTLVDERDLGIANSAWATLDNVAFIVGPALAGILLATGGLEIAFLLNAASFAVVAVVLWRLPIPKLPEAAPGSEAVPDAPKAGWRALVRPLAGPFILDSTTSLVGGGVGVLTVVIAIDVLNAGEAGTGYLNAAVGVGGVIAGIAGGALLARRLSVPLLIGGAAGGAGLAWLALTGDLVTAMLAIGVAVAGMLLLDVVNTTLIQRTVPDELRGRAMGALQTSSSVLYSLGSLAMPLLADVVGVTPVLIGAGAVMAAGTALALVMTEAQPQPEPVDAVRLRLLDHPIFAGLPAARLEVAARQLVAVPFEEGEAVVREGERADRFYVVDSGTVRVSQQGPSGEVVVLRDLGPGDVFGEIGLLRGVPRTATVTTMTPTVLYALDAAAFGDLVGSGPGLSTRMLDLYRGALSRS